MSIDYNNTGSILAPNISDYHLSNKDFSITFWFRVSSLIAGKTIMSQSIGGAASNSAFYVGMGYSPGTSSINFFPVQFDGSGFETPINTPNGSFVVDTNYFGCITRVVGASDTYKISINAVDLVTAVRTNLVYFQSTRSIDIGSQNLITLFDGELWDSRLYVGKALSIDEQKIMLNANGMDNITEGLVLRVPGNDGTNASSPVNVKDYSKNKNTFSKNGTLAYTTKPIITARRRIA